MYATPDDEVEACAMPKAAKEHGKNEIDVLPNLAFAVSAERNVDVIAYPCGERYVPTPPKVGDAGGCIGRIEVEGEMETQQQGYANGHV